VHDALSKWLKAVEKLKKASPLIALKALLAAVRNRAPPWEFRFSSATFELVAGVWADIHAWFEVDHVEKRVVFTLIELGESKSPDDVVD
jgi:hypothetical protein